MANSTTQLKYLIPNSLTHSAGTITAVFDSGTRQVVLSGLTAVTLYFLYLRTVSGTPTLFFSTTTPQAYRVANPGAVLVGAFYSNGNTSVAFGDFVNIEGAPETGWIPYNQVIKGSTSDPTLGTNMRVAYFRRRGDEVMVNSVTAQTAAGSAGSGTYVWALPGALVTDNVKVTLNVTSKHNWGFWSGYSSSGALYIVGHCQPAPAAVGGFWGFQLQRSNSNDNPVGSTESPTFSATDVRFGVDAHVPISGWSNVPLKDL